MKKISAIFMVLCMAILLCMPLCVSAENGLVMTMETSSAKQGDSFDVPITVTSNPGVFGMQIELNYDPQVLRFDGMTAGEPFAEKMNLLEVENKSCPVVIQYMANEIENVDVTGLLVTVHFKAYVGATLGDTTINVSYKAGNNINVDSEEVPVTINNGTVNVTEGLTSTDNEEDMPPKATQATADPNAKEESDSKNNSWIYFVIAGVVLLVAIVLIWLFAGNDDDEGKTQEEPTSEDITPPPAPVEMEETNKEE